MTLTTRYVACLPEAWLEALEAYRAAAQAQVVDEPAPIAARDGERVIMRVEGIVLPTRVAGMRCAPVDEMLRALEDIDGVREIELLIDSPGGVAQGLDVLHARLMSLRDAGITITARVDGLCASAAYWIASAASRIIARPIAEVGGIGVYRVYYDRSEALREAGIRPVVVRSGPHKALGVDAITDDQEAVELQNIMDIHSEFLQAVSAGRGMDPADVAVLATGRTWVARRALSVGIIDEVSDASSDDIADNQEDEIMSETSIEAVAMAAAEEPEAITTPAGAQADAPAEAAREASAADIERERCAALMEIFSRDASFAARAIREGWTLTEAKAFWFDEHAGASPAATTEPVAPVEPITADPASAREIVRREAEARGIPLAQAWARYWRENNIIR